MQTFERTGGRVIRRGFTRSLLAGGLILGSTLLTVAVAAPSAAAQQRDRRGDRDTTYRIPVPPDGQRRLPRIILDDDRDRRGDWDRGRRNRDWRDGDRRGRDRDRGRRRGDRRGRTSYPPLAFPYDYRYPHGGFGYGYGFDYGYGGGYAIPPLGGQWQSGPWHPQSLLLDSRVVPNPPLAPVDVQLRNSAARDLQVALVDLRDSSVMRSLRLEPGGTAGVRLTRDSGGRRISQYRTYDSWGYPEIEQVVTPIPPEPLYEVVVHEWAVQSVAIDRTGKSPSPIEDINLQGRGIGRFVLPAGSALQSGTIDVYRMAEAANNPGAIAPLVPEEGQPGSRNATPLERAILDAQRRSQTESAR